MGSYFMTINLRNIPILPISYKAGGNKFSIDVEGMRFELDKQSILIDTYTIKDCFKPSNSKEYVFCKRSNCAIYIDELITENFTETGLYHCPGTGQIEQADPVDGVADTLSQLIVTFITIDKKNIFLKNVKSKNNFYLPLAVLGSVQRPEFRDYTTADFTDYLS